MEYKIVIWNGYILGVGKVPCGGNINKETYDRITDMINNMPTAPEGFCYKLKENLEWELVKLELAQ